MPGRAPDPNDPLGKKPLPVSAFAWWVIADAVGFKGHDRVIASAVALAESTGNAHAIHSNTNGTADYGGWQINSVHKELFSQYDWTIPGDNGHMAYSVWQGAGGKWTPWNTYPNAANLQMNVAIANIKSFGVKNPDSDSGAPYLASLADILSNAVGQAAENSIPGVSSLNDIGNALQKIMNPKNWASVGFILLGGLLIIIIAYKMLASEELNLSEKVLNSPAGKLIKEVV